MVGRTYPAHQPSRDPRLRLMASKRVNGLQNLMGMLDTAKHQYWSEHGVNNHTFPDAHNNLQQFPGFEIKQVSTSVNPASSRASEQNSSRYKTSDPFVLEHPASPWAKASMVELTQMDSSSLVAAALAPPMDPQQRVKTGHSSKAVPGMKNPVQAVSPRLVN